MLTQLPRKLNCQMYARLIRHHSFLSSWKGFIRKVRTKLIKLFSFFFNILLLLMKKWIWLNVCTWGMRASSRCDWHICDFADVLNWNCQGFSLSKTHGSYTQPYLRNLNSTNSNSIQFERAKSSWPGKQVWKACLESRELELYNPLIN